MEPGWTPGDFRLEIHMLVGRTRRARRGSQAAYLQAAARKRIVRSLLMGRHTLSGRNPKVSCLPLARPLTMAMELRPP